MENKIFVINAKLKCHLTNLISCLPTFVMFFLSSICPVPASSHLHALVDIDVIILGQLSEAILQNFFRWSITQLTELRGAIRFLRQNIWVYSPGTQLHRIETYFWINVLRLFDGSFWIYSICVRTCSLFISFISFVGLGFWMAHSEIENRKHRVKTDTNHNRHIIIVLIHKL